MHFCTRQFVHTNTARWSTCIAHRFLPRRLDMQWIRYIHIGFRSSIQWNIFSYNFPRSRDNALNRLHRFAISLANAPAAVLSKRLVNLKAIGKFWNTNRAPSIITRILRNYPPPNHHFLYPSLSHMIIIFCSAKMGTLRYKAIYHGNCNVAWSYILLQWPLLLTWINFNPSMDK